MPALEAHNIEAIFVLDNASYHLTAYPGSVCVKDWANKTEAAKFMDDPTGMNSRAPTADDPAPAQVSIPFERGANFPKFSAGADTFEQMKAKATAWLDANAATHGILVDVCHLTQLCTEYGHHFLLTPPYHPELQPIEKLWRNVKEYVARLFSGNRAFNELWDQVRDGFLRYGTAEHCKHCVEEARSYEVRYSTVGMHIFSVTAEDEGLIKAGDGNVATEGLELDLICASDVSDDDLDEDEVIDKVNLPFYPPVPVDPRLPPAWDTCDESKTDSSEAED